MKMTNSRPYSNNNKMIMMDIIPNVVILTSRRRRDRDAGVCATFIRIIIIIIHYRDAFLAPMVNYY